MSKARGNEPTTFSGPSAGPNGPKEIRLDRGWAAEFSRVRLRALFALPLLALFLLGGRAEACPLTNPQCTVDQANKTVEETVKEVPEIVEEASDPVEETVQQVEKTVDDTTSDVQQTVDETLNPGSAEVEPPSPPSEPKNPPAGGGKKDDPRGNDRVRGQDTDTNGSAWRPDRSSDAGRSPAGTALETLTSSSELERPSEDKGLAESILDAARDFAFPLILTILVGAFLALQHRFDRRDPKLVLAPLDHDYLSFE